MYGSAGAGKFGKCCFKQFGLADRWIINTVYSVGHKGNLYSVDIHVKKQK